MGRVKYLRWSLVAGLLMSVACSEENDNPRSEPQPVRPHENAEQQCLFTAEFWKDHIVDSQVVTLNLGETSYGDLGLRRILEEPAGGNGLILLAHQLIAAKANITAGADTAEISDELRDAEILIGDLVIPPHSTGFLDPSVTADLTSALEDFNNGLTEAFCHPRTCGDGFWTIVPLGEACEDGNTIDGDGCSSICQWEHECGNGIVERPETCDDGNTTGGDHCSAACILECGNGILDAGEECDDGNTIDSDGCSATCECSSAST
jgi:cysteine-rich repeat protein